MWNGSKLGWEGSLNNVICFETQSTKKLGPKFEVASVVEAEEAARIQWDHDDPRMQ